MPHGFKNGKVVFILLTDIVTSHMGLITIDVRGVGLELIPKCSFLVFKPENLIE